MPPGTVAVLFGSLFEAGNTEVFFDDTPARVIEASDNRILLQIPPSLAGKSSASMIVRARGLTSAPANVALTTVSAGVFSRATAQYGGKPATNENGNSNGEGARAEPGSILTVTMTGADPNRYKISATFDGLETDVLDAETVQSFMPGLYRIRVRVPPALDGVRSLTLIAGGVTSPAVWIYLRTPAPVFQHLLRASRWRPRYCVRPFSQPAICGNSQ